MLETSAYPSEASQGEYNWLCQVGGDWGLELRFPGGFRGRGLMEGGLSASSPRKLLRLESQPLSRLLDELEELVVLLDPKPGPGGTMSYGTTRHLAARYGLPAAWSTFAYSLRPSCSPLRGPDRDGGKGALCLSGPAWHTPGPHRTGRRTEGAVQTWLIWGLPGLVLNKNKVSLEVSACCHWVS